MLPLHYLVIKILTIIETRSQQRSRRMSQGQGQGVQPQAQVPPQGLAQAAPIAPAFALGPGRGNALLDYSNASHIKTNYKAVTPLEHKFDGKPSNLHIFMKGITNQAKSFGWVNILNINE